MTHTYSIEGMSCNGCREKVEKALNSIEGITAQVSLDPPQAIITMAAHIPTEDLQQELSQAGNYKIRMQDHKSSDSQGHHNHHPEKQIVNHKEEGRNPKCAKYYCPMHCEGGKTYDKPGSCPVCGMNLEKVPQLQAAASKYTCPMHPEIVKDAPGACPICGMDLIPLASSDDSEEENHYKILRRKFWIAVAFTLPVFVLAMGEMIPGDPL